MLNLFKSVLIFSLLSQNLYSEVIEKKKVEITWVLAHEPITLFEEAAKKFSSLVNEKSNGEILVNVVTSANLKNGKVISPLAVYEKVRSGEIQMSQGYTTALGVYSPQFWVLDLPFLFDSHDHATKVLEGEIGQSLLATLDEKNIKGLAFTYSGGYRIIPSVKREIHRYEDIKGMKVSVAPTPVFEELYKLLGAIPVKMNSLDVAKEQLRVGVSDASESTYPRFLPLEYEKVAGIVNETNHSLFLTSLIINKDFFESLTKEQQAILQESATEAARLERNITVASHDKSREDCEELGLKVVRLSDYERERFKNAVEPLYGKFEQYFSKDLVDRIKKTN